MRFDPAATTAASQHKTRSGRGRLHYSDADEIQSVLLVRFFIVGRLQSTAQLNELPSTARRPTETIEPAWIAAEPSRSSRQIGRSLWNGDWRQFPSSSATSRTGEPLATTKFLLFFINEAGCLTVRLSFFPFFFFCAIANWHARSLWFVDCVRQATSKRPLAPHFHELRRVKSQDLKWNVFGDYRPLLRTSSVTIVKSSWQSHDLLLSVYSEAHHEMADNKAPFAQPAVVNFMGQVPTPLLPAPHAMKASGIYS